MVLKTRSGLVLSEERQVQASRVERDNVAARVDFIVELMAALEYVPGETDRVLAAIWGLADSSVRNNTAEASRRTKACFTEGNADLLRAQLLAEMLRVGALAAARTKEVVDRSGVVHSVKDPDIRTALQAIVEVSTFMGLKVERHEHSFRPAEELSNAEIVKQLLELFAEQPEIFRNLEAAGWHVTPPKLPDVAGDALQ